MRYLFLSALVFTGCQSSEEVAEETPAEARFSVHPPVGGLGTEVTVRLSSTASRFAFADTTLDLGDGITVTSLTVHDGYEATAVVEVADDAPLGIRDATIGIQGRENVIEDGFEVIAESLVIDPANAKMGETVQVALVGKSVAWEDGYSWPDFGDGVEILSFTVVSPTVATAQISVAPDAMPGLRDVSVTSGPDVVTNYGGFTVDRAAITAVFEPKAALQGETVEFTVRGLDTNFLSGMSLTDIAFWDQGRANADVQVTELVVLDSENLYGRLRLSNAARVGFRDVLLQGAEDVLIPDGFEVLDAPPDLSRVAVGLSFDVAREIDNATGALLEQVSASAVFYIPLDPPCGAPPPDMPGPPPFDVNGVFQPTFYDVVVDCPRAETVSAGDVVWFESDQNIVTLQKDVSGSTGQIFYRGIDLTLNDYRFGELYDLHTQGDPDGVPEVLVEDVQPTVPGDYYLLSPDMWGDYTHSRAEPLAFTWTPAQTYPEAIFAVSIWNTLVQSGEMGYASVLPWDDGAHAFSPSDLLLLEPGPVPFNMASAIEGRYFGLPFSSIQTNKSGSTLSTSASLVLE